MLSRAAVGIGLLAVACGGPADTPPAPTVSSAAADGLPGFPACQSRPPSAATPPVGAALPDGALVESVEDHDPLVYVRGYVEEVPLDLRGAYESDEDLEILVIEDEGLEVETLVTDGSHRTFFKANAVCATGSTFIAVVAPEVEASLVPTPTGQPGS